MLETGIRVQFNFLWRFSAGGRTLFCHEDSIYTGCRFQNFETFIWLKKTNYESSPTYLRGMRTAAKRLLVYSTNPCILIARFYVLFTASSNSILKLGWLDLLKYTNTWNTIVDNNQYSVIPTFFWVVLLKYHRWPLDDTVFYWLEKSFASTYNNRLLISLVYNFYIRNNNSVILVRSISIDTRFLKNNLT